jgi:hypothetical protein
MNKSDIHHFPISFPKNDDFSFSFFSDVGVEDGGDPIGTVFSFIMTVGTLL